jgi:hypothetical protein
MQDQDAQVDALRKGVATRPSYMTPPRGGLVNDCSCFMFIDKRTTNDRVARGATQLQPNHDSFEFRSLSPCSL